MEAFFYFWQQFFSAPSQSPGRDAQQPPQLPGHIGPELPQRPQRRRRQQQIQGHARPGAQQHIQLRLPAAYLGQHPQGPQQAQQGEQPQNHREEKFCAPADLVEPKMRTGLVLFQGNGRHGSFLLSQNKLLSSSSLRTTALAVMMQMKPTRFCRKPAAVDMPTLRVEV